jgi:hypothetical protein
MAIMRWNVSISGVLDIDKVRIDIMMLPGLQFLVLWKIVLIFVSESDSWFFLCCWQTKKLTCNHTEKDLFLDFPNKKATDAHNK